MQIDGMDRIDELRDALGVHVSRLFILNKWLLSMQSLRSVLPSHAGELARRTDISFLFYRFVRHGIDIVRFAHGEFGHCQ